VSASKEAFKASLCGHCSNRLTIATGKNEAIHPCASCHRALAPSAYDNVIIDHHCRECSEGGRMHATGGSSPEHQVAPPLRSGKHQAAARDGGSLGALRSTALDDARRP